MAIFSASQASREKEGEEVVGLWNQNRCRDRGRRKRKKEGDTAFAEARGRKEGKKKKRPAMSKAFHQGKKRGGKKTRSRASPPSPKIRKEGRILSHLIRKERQKGGGKKNGYRSENGELSLQRGNSFLSSRLELSERREKKKRPTKCSSAPSVGYAKKGGWSTRSIPPRQGEGKKKASQKATWSRMRTPLAIRREEEEGERMSAYSGTCSLRE